MGLVGIDIPTCLSFVPASLTISLVVPREGEHLLLDQVLALLLVHLLPVLLLAFLGAVVDQLALRALFDAAIIGWLRPPIDITVATTHAGLGH